MSLKSKTAISFLGITAGVLMPLMSADAAKSAAAPATNQASDRAAAVQATDQPGDKATTTTQKLADQPNNKSNTTIAKDQPVAKQLDWNGTFIGVYGGGAWGRSSLNSNAGNVTSSSYFTSAANIASVSQNSSGTIHPNNTIGGIQLINNTQSGHLVYGSVIEYGSFHLTQSKSITNITYPTLPSQYSVKTHISTSWLAAVRGRLGWAFPAKWPLVYLTGGLALTNLSIFNNFGDNTASNGVGGYTNTKIKPGWILGAGIEVPIRTTWTINGEYQYVHFASNTANGFITCRGGSCASRSPFSTSANLNASMVKFGLNYRFA